MCLQDESGEPTLIEQTVQYVELHSPMARFAVAKCSEPKSTRICGHPTGTRVIQSAVHQSARELSRVQKFQQQSMVPKFGG